MFDSSGMTADRRGLAPVRSEEFEDGRGSADDRDRGPDTMLRDTSHAAGTIHASRHDVTNLIVHMTQTAHAVLDIVCDDVDSCDERLQELALEAVDLPGEALNGPSQHN
jgi:hypothetical protein